MSSRFRRANAAVVLLSGLASGLIGGCSREETIVSPLQMIDFADAASCIGDQGVDTIAIDLVQFGGEATTGAGLRTTCRQCASGDVDCTLLARHCLCVGKRGTLDEISEAIAGLRLEDLDPTALICVRLMGIYRGAEEGPSAGPGASCDPQLCGPTSAESPEDDVAICMLTGVGSVSESGIPFVFREVACSGGLTRLLGQLSCTRLAELCSTERFAICLEYQRRCTGSGPPIPSVSPVAECVAVTSPAERMR